MKQTTAWMAVLAVALVALACRAERNMEHGSTATSQAGMVTTYGNHDFSRVEVSGQVKTYITQGDRYSVEVTESSNPDLETVVEQRGQTLHVYNRQKKRSVNLQADQRPVVRITMPRLVGLQARGATTFSVGAFSTTDALHVDVSGASCGEFDTVACGELRINCSGASNMEMESVRCTDVRSLVSGASKLQAQMKATGDITLTCGGASKQRLTLQGRKLKIENSGASHSEVTFTGDCVDARNSGAGDTRLTVDCRELKAQNSGASKFTISGTADHTDIDASGVSKINTSKLNQF